MQVLPTIIGHEQLDRISYISSVDVRYSTSKGNSMHVTKDYGELEALLRIIKLHTLFMMMFMPLSIEPLDENI